MPARKKKKPTCRYCGKRLSCSSNLTRHVNKACPYSPKPAEKPRCPSCGITCGLKTYARHVAICLKIPDRTQPTSTPSTESAQDSSFDLSSNSHEKPSDSKTQEKPLADIKKEVHSLTQEEVKSTEPLLIRDDLPHSPKNILSNISIKTDLGPLDTSDDIYADIRESVKGCNFPKQRNTTDIHKNPSKPPNNQIMLNGHQVQEKLSAYLESLQRRGVMVFT
uniref:Zinc finger protein LOC723797 n=1 Tax=Phallusia mammillata TaxID=59560 RepID=A0A6F9DKJ6_9ASCI|nr:zinc finger protein LOC723797 [Phallusia mammillata]